MPSVIVKCSDCNDVLDVKNSCVNNMGDIVIVIKTCLNMKCLPDTYGECAECEDVEILKKLRSILK